MKPAAIADYLDHLACIAFHVDNETGAVRPPADEQAPRAGDRGSAAAEASLRKSLAAREAAKAEEMALRTSPRRTRAAGRKVSRKGGPRLRTCWRPNALLLSARR